MEYNDIENGKDCYYYHNKIKKTKKFSPFKLNGIKENKDSKDKNKFKFNSYDNNKQNFQRKDNINKEIFGSNNINIVNRVYKPIYNPNKNIENEYIPIFRKTNDYIKLMSNYQHIKVDNLIFNNNLNFNDKKSDNILYSKYKSTNKDFSNMIYKKPNNLIKNNLNKNRFQTPEKISMQNNFSFNNNSYHKNNDINFNLNSNQKKDYNTFSENKIQINKNKLIINDKKDDQAEEIKLSKIADDLYNSNIENGIINKEDSKVNLEDNEAFVQKYEKDIFDFDYEKEFKEDLKSLNDEDIFDSNLFLNKNTNIRPFNQNGKSTIEILELSENEEGILSLSISSENFNYINNFNVNNNYNNNDINELESSFSSLNNNNESKVSKTSTDYSTNALKINSNNQL